MLAEQVALLPCKDAGGSDHQRYHHDTKQPLHLHMQRNTDPTPHADAAKAVPNSSSPCMTAACMHSRTRTGPGAGAANAGAGRAVKPWRRREAAHAGAGASSACRPRHHVYHTPFKALTSFPPSAPQGRNKGLPRHPREVQEGTRKGIPCPPFALTADHASELSCTPPPTPPPTVTH